MKVLAHMVYAVIFDNQEILKFFASWEELSQ